MLLHLQIKVEVLLLWRNNNKLTELLKDKNTYEQIT